MLRLASAWVGGIAAVLVACVCALHAQNAAIDLTTEAPADLAPIAARVRDIDQAQLGEALARAGLEMPPSAHVELVPETDRRAREASRWIVGLAYGRRNVIIFPARISSYPHDTLESVVRHEIVHLALNLRAGGRPLPRWFHEGVATSVETGWGVTGQLRLVFAILSQPGLRDVGRLFGSDGESGTAEAYLLAAALVEDLRKRHGAALPGAIAQRVARGTSFARAFELETGETPDAAAARAWAAYRRWVAWIPAITSTSAVWALIIVLAFVAFLVRLRRRRRSSDDDVEEPGL